MGLIKALLGAAGGTLADQWKEFFYCEALDTDTLVVRGRKRISGRSSNTKGNDNIISSGSGIAVADGQCMIIVEQGKIVEACAEPGEYTFDASTEPSVFAGTLGEGFKTFFTTAAKRFTYGGDSGKDQRVYYFNIKEITGNKFGTATPVPFRVVDANIGLDIDVSLRCNGVYSYKLANPILFYQNVCGNVSSIYDRSEIDAQLKSEFISALQPSFSRLSDLQIRPNSIPGHVRELCDALNRELSDKWSGLRGIEVVSVAINSITLPDEDQDLIKQAQKNAILRDPSMAGATLAGAQADAMKAAASNTAGAMSGFMGMGMAAQAGGMNAQSLFNMAQQQGNSPRMQAGSWTCSCGAVNSGKFCQNCGAPKPADPGSWTCSCGAVNTGKFCQNCGSPRPSAGAKCAKCGWETDGAAPKFCPECGNPF